LRNSNPFKNLIVNGLVLAKDGTKMSKSKKNYDDPMEVVNKYGADAVRLYLMNSPLVKAEELKFNTEGVWTTVRSVFLPWYNAYRFFIQNATRYETVTGNKFTYDETLRSSGNLMDSWMQSILNGLVRFVRNEMENYRLYTVVPKLLGFLEQLTNWYVRLNRNRLKGDHGNEEWIAGLNVLYESILKVSVLMAPFTPFLTEMLYQNLKSCLPEGHVLNQPSIHFLSMPTFDESLVNESID
jgi:isoleucyl-tRNA synthetase